MAKTSSSTNSELQAKLKHYRLSESEYELIGQQLGRPPRGLEWALYSALWSEHCSYKSSKIHLKKFFNKSPRVLQSFGENAGVIDLGQGERVAFKMESHNHPSYIEPFQGAATGVGGILRDIFTMGARPIALANYLCFGEPTAPRMSALVDGVVRGISSYGNCVGVPTVTGQTEFHSSYNGNILVNALALGLFRPGEKVLTAKASGIGHHVVYVGAKTGRDGVHGASMASESFDEDSESKRPTIQIGDPFLEKLLIESCIEVMNRGLVIAIQDMGAAGLTSSSFEMASRGGVGFRIHLDQVPLRDHSITPEEIMLSESQERMLLICEPAKFNELKSVFDHWNLDAKVIGEVTAEKEVQLFWRGEEICKINPDLLVETAPQYERPFEAWQPQRRTTDTKELVSQVTNARETLLGILTSATACSRDWVFHQYDQRVGGATVRDSRESVAVMRLPDSGRALALALGCRPYMMRWDAAQGAIDSIAYPALELACKGFEPLAVTDCLNFGNPERPALMSEFVASVENMSRMCEALQAPVISGNVSFYNETLGKNVTSTPATGIVGLRATIDCLPSSHFTDSGHAIYLLRLPQITVSGQLSEQQSGHMLGRGDISTRAVAEFTRQLMNLVNTLNEKSCVIESSRVVGKYGVGYALARMCEFKNVGARIHNMRWILDGMTPAAGLFAENYYEVLLAIREPAQFEAKTNSMKWPQGVQVFKLGETGGDNLVIDTGMAPVLDIQLSEIKNAYRNAWGANLAGLE